MFLFFYRHQATKLFSDNDKTYFKAVLLYSHVLNNRFRAFLLLGLSFLVNVFFIVTKCSCYYCKTQFLNPEHYTKLQPNFPYICLL